MHVEGKLRENTHADTIAPLDHVHLSVRQFETFYAMWRDYVTVLRTTITTWSRNCVTVSLYVKTYQKLTHKLHDSEFIQGHYRIADASWFIT